MSKFRVKGIYKMTFLVDVDQVVSADNKDDAVEEVQDSITAEEAYDQLCDWVTWRYGDKSLIVEKI